MSLTKRRFSDKLREMNLVRSEYEPEVLNEKEGRRLINDSITIPADDRETTIEKIEVEKQNTEGYLQELRKKLRHIKRRGYVDVGTAEAGISNFEEDLKVKIEELLVNYINDYQDKDNEKSEHYKAVLDNFMGRETETGTEFITENDFKGRDWKDFRKLVIDNIEKEIKKSESIVEQDKNSIEDLKYNLV